MEQREEIPQDPSVPKRLENTRNPWAIVAYTEEDLDLALHRWENLIQAIEDRIPDARSEVPHSTGIVPVEVLRTAGVEEERFAYKFFTLVALCPFGDGCQLVLPYKIAGPVRRRRWSGEWENSNTSLLQLSQNPFIIEHRSQLALFLGYFAKAVVDDLWTINKEGVANNADWYKMAESDDEDVRKQFVVPVGPDRQWC
ncbi:hypothetical protein B9Z65_3014 [Elsinoe australis]|uniref:Uncharacterized protein n=1 Tax=Elsinoe australis TaxID=40998 RepID=A0A2P7ZU59_9PEZI|nr:hypothetical protein B9Z65_3014 [Elsinoe australis]